MKTSPWIEIDHCATRIIEGGNLYTVKDRVAFIEKSPRIRIAPWNGDNFRDSDNWKYGQKGYDGKTVESREWCDNELKKLGYELG